LAIGYRQPRELGVDRLAAALGARQLWPRRNVIFVDFGTATTVTALTAGGRIAGGAIFPGFGLWTEMLAARTAQLPAVEMGLPRRALGRDTRAGIASGVFFGHAGAVRELVARISGEAFGRGKFLVVGTGGNAARFRRENVFAQYEPNLILVGLHAFAHV
jgi:type III pantothenate kinase